MTFFRSDFFIFKIHIAVYPMLQTAWKKLFWIKSNGLLNIGTKPPKSHFWLVFSRKSEKVTKKHQNASFSAFWPRFWLKIGMQTPWVMFQWYLQKVFCEHQLTSKNRQSRAISVTKISKQPPDDEKSYKMTSYDFFDFRFGFYGGNYVRNVPKGFSSAFLQELSRTEQCSSTEKIIWKVTSSRPQHLTPRESAGYQRLGI